MRTVITIIAALAFTAVRADVSTAVRQEWDRQYRQLQEQTLQAQLMSKHRYWRGVPQEQVVNRQALIRDTDRDALDVQFRRTGEMLSKLKRAPGAGDRFQTLEKQYQDLLNRKTTAGLGKVGTDTEQDQALYLELKKITRKAQLDNPLLDDYTDLLFIERSVKADLTGGEVDGDHMNDQYHGFTARKGGGLFILKNFKSSNPTLVNVVEGLQVPSGTDAGMQMSEGVFLSPELSWDGRIIYFSWHSGGTEKWSDETRWHIFKINVDGTGLTRLTDGPYDHYDPCLLPNGRVVFISNRRGGMGRCHPHMKPTTTLYSMKDDGSDLFCLSFHETNEWHPSVNNDGMIVYTRWDYVDRDSDIAHHIWTCYPDGRDPRAPHGNYPWPFTTIPEADHFNLVDGDGRKKRPWMEQNIRAIPNSHKYVATSSLHHGQAFGTLVLIDPSIEDDNVTSQITRLTPDIRFPEAETGTEQSLEKYGTAWPLSEGFFIVNYEDGIYLLDDAQNRELIYRARGDDFRAIDPIPIGPRKIPNVIPTATFQGERLTETAPNATISIMNVYIADLEWPENTEIKEMRIVQLFPKETPLNDRPRIHYGKQGLVRMSLGTVPVEEDGSVYCMAPVGREIYFQLLDQHGTAVHSMRSGTYVHPGEQMTCTGCHESKWENIPMNTNPLAMQRKPSPLIPEPGGLEPIGFYRLVKPVLEEHCGTCHHSGGTPPDLSYGSLESYAFHFHGGGNGSINAGTHGGSRTIPGYFGAQYAKLYKDGYLSSDHYNVNMSAEELRRITLWLDNMSNELIAYFDVDKQRNGELVWPNLDIDHDNLQAVEDRGTAGCMVPGYLEFDPLATTNDPSMCMTSVSDENRSRHRGLSLRTMNNQVKILLPAQGYQIGFYNLSGEQVLVYQAGPEKEVLISTRPLPQGMYTVRAFRGKAVLQAKLIIL